MTKDEKVDYALFVYIGGLCYQEETKQNECWLLNLQYLTPRNAQQHHLFEGGQVDLYNNQYN